MNDQTMPKSVRYYERLTYAGMVVVFINQLVNWDRTASHFAEALHIFTIVQIMFPCVQIFWVWLVVRKRVNWARWMTLGAQFAVMFVIGFGFGIIANKGHADGTVLELVFLILATSLYLLAACLLFTRDAILWFVPQRAEFGHAVAGSSDSSASPPAHSFSRVESWS
ncbi:hypothetical protein [Rhizobium sp. BR 315]|uniref:hypothetical protein n=1 Tax=Rhizobium sp. BR 315 TaxID=3040014 RepID=UPI003D325B44